MTSWKRSTTSSFIQPPTLTCKAEFIKTNPGANYDEIIQHIIDTIPERVTVHLDQMEGDYLRVEEGRYYTREEVNSVMEVA